MTGMTLDLGPDPKLCPACLGVPGEAHACGAPGRCSTVADRLARVEALGLTPRDLIAETLTARLGLPEGVTVAFDDDAPPADSVAMARACEAIAGAVLGQRDSSGDDDFFEA